MAQDHISVEFIKGAVQPDQYPDLGLPEVAMIGRSNVGKSSLINAIVRQGNVARVSNTPGKTQEINFFATNLGIVLVDLPGYGYATVSKERRELFAKSIKTYLFNRTPLALVCVLIDGRHDPQPLDMAMLEELELNGRNFVAVLTKCDKLSAKDVERRHAQVKELLSQCRFAVDVIVTSSKTGDGRSSLIGIMKRTRDQHQQASS